MRTSGSGTADDEHGGATSGRRRAFALAVLAVLVAVGVGVAVARSRDRPARVVEAVGVPGGCGEQLFVTEVATGHSFLGGSRPSEPLGPIQVPMGVAPYLTPTSAQGWHGTLRVDPEDDAPSRLTLANATFRSAGGEEIRVTDRYDAIC